MTIAFVKQQQQELPEPETKTTTTTKQHKYDVGQPNVFLRSFAQISPYII